MYLSRTFRRPAPLSTLTRSLHASPRLFGRDKTTKGSAPDSSRDHFPVESVLLDQNTHLKHAVSSKGGDEGRDRGQGNAAANPELPSKKFENDRVKTLGTLKDAGRGSENVLVVESEKHVRVHVEEHSTDDYLKEVDSNPPASTKTHRIDGNNDATHRPNEQYADIEKEYTATNRGSTSL